MNTSTALPFDLIAFDLDGTLVDSAPDLHAALNRMLRDQSLPSCTDADTRHWVGNGVGKLVERAMRKALLRDPSDKEQETALETFKAHYDDCNGRYAALYPGVRTGLEQLGALHVPMVIITNKAARFTRPLLESLDIAKFFVFTISGDEVNRLKPHPEALLQAASRIGAQPRRSVMVGDSEHDCRAAFDAGFRRVAVSYGYNHGRPISTLQGLERPEVVLDSLVHLNQTLRQIGLVRNPDACVLL